MTIRELKKELLVELEESLGVDRSEGGDYQLGYIHALLIPLFLIYNIEPTDIPSGESIIGYAQTHLSNFLKRRG